MWRHILHQRSTKQNHPECSTPNALCWETTFDYIVRSEMPSMSLRYDFGVLLFKVRPEREGPCELVRITVAIPKNEHSWLRYFTVGTQQISKLEVLYDFVALYYLVIESRRPSIRRGHFFLCLLKKWTRKWIKYYYSTKTTTTVVLSRD